MDYQGGNNDADPENIPDTPTSLPKLNQGIQPSLTTFDPKTATVQAEPEVIGKNLEESEEILDEDQQEQLQNAANTSMNESQKSFGLGGIQDEDAYQMEEEEEQYSVAESQLEDEEEEEEEEVVPELMADDMDGDHKLETSKEEEVKNDIPQEEYDYLNINFDYEDEPKAQAEPANAQDEGPGLFADLNNIVVDVDNKDKDKKKGKDKDKDKGDKDKKGKDKGDKNQSPDKQKKNEKDNKKKGKDDDKKEGDDKAKLEGTDEITTIKKPEDAGKDGADLAQADGEKKEGTEAVDGATKDATKEKKDADQKSEGKKSDKSKPPVKTIVPSNIGFKDMAAYRENYLKQKLAQDKINAAVRKRKIMRYIYYFLLLGIIGAVIALAIVFENMTGTIRYEANKDIFINADNCTVNIYDYEGDDSSPIILEYKVPRGLDVDNGGSSVTYDSETNPTKLHLINGFGKYVYRCVADLYVKPGTQLGDLTLSCGKCRLTQDSAKLKVGTLTLKGDEVNATLKDVSVDHVTFEANVGYIQLTHVVTTADSTIKVKSSGNIVIQSTKDLNIVGKSDTQAFCFWAPHVTQTSADDCWVSGDDASKTNKALTTCAPEYTLCKTGTCDSAQKFTVDSTQGNIYANFIPAIGKNIIKADYESAYGGTYDQGIRMSADAAEKISNFSSQASDSSVNSPMIILDLGNFESRSAQYMKWVITANPAYAYMKPWWMSIFSATILTNFQERVSGFLLPGFCPYYPVYNIEDMDLIRFKLLKNASYEYAIATFVVDQDGITPTLAHPESTGIFKYSESRAPNDFWYSTVQNQDGRTYSLIDNNINQKLIILFAIILSIIIAFYVTFLLTEIFTIGVNRMYYKVVDFANHLESYSVLQKKKVDIAVEEALKVEEKKDEPVTKGKRRKVAEKKKSSKEIKHNFANIMRSAPSLSAFIDYLCLILYRQFSNSVDQFYRLLFVETTTRDDEAPDPNKDAIKGSEAKVLYEKFCFMNHLVEQRLTDENNLKILRKYGFDIVTRTDLLSEVFTRVNIKKHENFLVQAGDVSDTLKLYIESNVEITAFEEDQVEVDYFIKLYYNFCDYNRLPKVLVSPTLMKDVFGVETKNVPQQFIMIKKEEDDLRTVPKSILEKIKYRLERRQRERVYKIDVTRIQDHFDLRLRKPLPLDRLQAATIESITYKGWWIWDFITVVLHMSVTLFLSVPLLILVIVMETQYSPFSMKDPSILIQPSDFTRDFGNLMEKLFMTFGWNIAIVVIVCIFWVISFFDIIIYYSVMDFPQDKSFTKSEEMKSESALLRFSRRLEWILIFAALMFYFGYIGLLLVWLLLGAIINPNAFLPFTSAAATFVAFCKSKYTDFKNLSKDGTKKIKEFLDKIFGGTISKVLGKITQSLSQAAGYVANKGKSLLKSDAFKMVSGKLAESGVIDAATLESYSRKVESLDPKAVLAGAAALARDPMIIQREMEKLAAELKEKAIKKVKSECTKRGIPEDLVDLILAVSLKQEEQTKTALRGLLTKISYRVYFPQDSIDVVIELLYPKSVNKEETVQYILEKIISIMYNQLYLGYYVPGLTPEILVQFFTNFKKLRDLNFEEFILGLKGIMEKAPKFKEMKEVNAFLPVLDIIAVMAREKPNWTKLKEPSMVLLSGAIKFFYSKQYDKDLVNREEKARKEKEDKERKGIVEEETEDQRKERLQKEEEQRQQDIKDKNKDEIIDDFVKFLRVLSAGQETVVQSDQSGSTEESEKKTMDSKETIKMFAKFLAHLGVTEKSLGENKELGERTIPSLLMLLLSVAKGELHEIPQDVYHEVEKMLGLSSTLNKNEIISFAFNLIHCINTKPKDIFPRLSQSLGVYGWPADIQDFLKILTCYPLEEWEQFCNSILIHENTHFMHIAKTMNIESKEFLGLINMIYRKRIDTSDEFLKLVLTRMNVKLDKLKPIKSLLELLLSEDEHTLLRAIKNLDLEQGHFLLMGKFIFNPLFIPKSEFEKLGIDKDGQRVKIFNATPEEYEIWKSGLKKEMGDRVNAKKREIEKEKKDQQYEKTPNFTRAQELQAELDEYEVQRQYLNIYLSDWRAQIYTKKNVLSIINALDNPYNNLKKALGADEGTLLTGVDCLYTILNIKDLLIEENTRYEKLDKEKKNAIREFANIFNINDHLLERALTLFVVSDANEVISSFVEFVPAQKKNYSQLVKAYSYGQKVMDGLKQVSNFISKKFPEAIELPDAALNIPAGLIKKLFWGTKHLSNQDFLDLLQLALKKVFPKDSERESILFNCYYIGLFAKGQLGDSTIKGILNIKKMEYLKVFKLFTLKDDNERLSLLSELFTDHEHPIKYFLAFYGILTKKEFDIVTVKKVKAGSGKNKIDTTETKRYTCKEFIATKFGIHQELLDLLEVVYERDISKFIQLALRIVRRIQGDSFVDTNMLETIFALSIGEHFNPTYLANKLGVTPEIIEFLMSLLRLSNEGQRKKEIARVTNSIPFKNVCSKLKIVYPEFEAMFKLLFNLFDDNSISDLVRRLELQDKINIEKLTGLMAINKQLDYNQSISDNKAEADKTKVKTEKFFEELDLNVDYGFLISRLVAGDLLTLRHNRQFLDWIFPSDDTKAEEAIRSLTCGICGLLNTKTGVSKDLNNAARSFYNAFYPKKKKSKDGKEEKFVISEPEPAGAQNVVPNNSLAYAIYLTHLTLDIAPTWTQLFLFDDKTFDSVCSDKGVPMISKEYLVSLVLSWINVPDCSRDAFGINEWNLKNIAYYLEKTTKTKNPAFGKENFHSFYVRRFAFTTESMIELAIKTGLKDTPTIMKLFDDPKKYNINVNTTLLYFLLLKDKNLRREVSPKITNKLLELPPPEFLNKAVLIMLNNETLKEDAAAKLVGEYMESILVRTYKAIHRRFYGQPRITGFALTNFCILGSISVLRSSDKQDMDYVRLLYNINQLWANIEKKLYLQDEFIKLPKIPLIKISGICLGWQLSNLIEFSLPPSLVSNQFILDVYKETESKDTRGLSAEEKALKIQELRIKELENKCLNYYNYEFIFSDAGYYSGNWSEFNYSYTRMLTAEDWEFTIVYFNLKDKYLGDPDGQFAMTKDRAQWNYFYKKCELPEETPLEHRDQVFMSKSILSLIYEPSYAGMIRHTEERLRLKNEKDYKEYDPEAEVPQKMEAPEAKEGEKKVELIKKVETEEEKELAYYCEQLVDIRTGLHYNVLESKSYQFEVALMSPNTNLIIGIIHGETEVLLKKDNAIGQSVAKDPLAPRIYRALLGLQSYNKLAKKDKKLLKEYLSVISNERGSDMSRIEELLNFFMTRKISLNEVFSTLEISNERMIDLLFMNIKLSNKNADDDDDIVLEDEQEAFDLPKVLQNVLNLDENEIKMFELLRDVYLVRKEGWLRCVSRLVKRSDDSSSEEEEEEEEEEDEDANKGFLARKKTNAVKFNFPDAIKNNPLFKLINLIDFKALKNDILLGRGKSMCDYIKSTKKPGSGVISIIFEEVILELKFFKDQLDEAKRNSLIRLFGAMEGIFKHKFDLLFKEFILPEFEIPPSVKYPELATPTKLPSAQPNADPNAQPNPNPDPNAQPNVQATGADGQPATGQPVAQPLSPKNKPSEQKPAPAAKKGKKGQVEEVDDDKFKIEKPGILEDLFTLFGVDVNTKSYVSIKRIVSLFFTFCHEDLQSLKKNPVMKNVLQNLIHEISQTEFISFLKEKEDKRRISQLLLGILTWDLETLLNAFLSENTLQEAYLLANLYCVTKLHKMFKNAKEHSSVIESCLKCVISTVIKRLSNKNAATTLFQNGGSFSSLFNSETSGDNDKKAQVKAIQGKIKNLFQQIEKSEQPRVDDRGKQISPASYFRLIADSFKDPNQKFVNTYYGQYNLIIEIIRSIGDGSIVVKVMNFIKSKNGNFNQPLELAVAIIKLFLPFVEKFFTTEGKLPENQGRISSEIDAGLSGLLESIKKVSNDKIWAPISKIAPGVMKMYLAFQSTTKGSSGSLKVKVLTVIMTLFKSIDDESQKDLIIDIMSMVMGTNLRSWYDKAVPKTKDEKPVEVKIMVDLSPSDRLRIFFNRIVLKFFPQLNYYIKGDKFEKLFEMTTKLTNDFLRNMKDPQKVRDIFISIIPILSDFNIVHKSVGKPLIMILEGKLENDSEEVIMYLIPDGKKDTAKKSIKYLKQIRELLSGNFETLNNIQLPISLGGSSGPDESNTDEWAEIMKKIKEGTASSKDLFLAVDNAGDKSGSINEEEFLMLAKRLGLQLSSHRVKEIFAKVKGKKVKDGQQSLELNEKEFSKALDYLNGKNLMQALTQLGITPEILTAILIRLIILLLLIFVFIFLGISSFALGGTFGAIINSTFPAAGGGALGKKSEADKEKLNNENVENAAENSININTTQNL